MTMKVVKPVECKSGAFMYMGLCNVRWVRVWKHFVDFRMIVNSVPSVDTCVCV